MSARNSLPRFGYAVKGRREMWLMGVLWFFLFLFLKVEKTQTCLNVIRMKPIKGVYS